MKHYLDYLGFVAGMTLPLFNIPLILRLFKRKSSEDVSLAWALGVFFCLLLMTPSAWYSPDPLFRAFAVSNLVLFSGVAFLVVYYRVRR